MNQTMELSKEQIGIIYAPKSPLVAPRDARGKIDETPEEKDARSKANKAYRLRRFKVKSDDFRQIISNLVKYYEAINKIERRLNLVKMDIKLNKKGTRPFLQFNLGKQGIKYIDSKQITASKNNFIRLLKQLNVYFRNSKRTDREASKPEDFKGVYAPVVAGEALKAFYNPVNNSGAPAFVAVLNRLAQAQAGYLLRNTITMLFYVYSYANGTNKAVDHRKKGSAPSGSFASFAPNSGGDIAFAGNIPAEYYSRPVGKTKEKMLMGTAIQQNLVTPNDDGAVVVNGQFLGLNTFGVLAKNPAYAGTSTESFNIYLYQVIASVNYTGANELNDILASAQAVGEQEYADYATAALGIINDPNNRAAMLQEHNVVKSASAELRKQAQARASTGSNVENEM